MEIEQIKSVVEKMSVPELSENFIHFGVLYRKNRRFIAKHPDLDVYIGYLKKHNEICLNVRKICIERLSEIKLIRVKQLSLFN